MLDFAESDFIFAPRKFLPQLAMEADPMTRAHELLIFYQNKSALLVAFVVSVL